MVSFRGNVPCRVLSKLTGDNANLWEIEVQGRRGYAPNRMLLEQKILIKTSDLVEVEVESMISDKAKDLNLQKGATGIESIDEMLLTSDNEQYFNPRKVETENESIEKVNLSADPKKSLEESVFEAVQGLAEKRNDNENIDKLNEFEEQKIHLEVVGFNSVEDIDDGEEASSITTDEDVVRNDVISHEISMDTSIFTSSNYTESSSSEKDNRNFRMNSDSIEMPDQINRFQESITVSKKNGETCINEKECDDVIIDSTQISDDQSEKNTFSVINGPKEDDNIWEIPNKMGIMNIDANSNVPIQDYSLNQKTSKELTMDITASDMSIENIVEENSVLVTLNGNSPIDEDSQMIESTTSKESKGKEGTSLKYESFDLSQSELIQDYSNQKHIEEDIDKSDYIGQPPIINENHEASPETLVHSIQTTVLSYIKSSFDFFLSKLRNVSNLHEKYQLFFPTVGFSSRQESLDHMKYEVFFIEFFKRIVALTDIIVFLVLTSSSIIIFLFGQRYFMNQRKEALLILKLNNLERKLLLSEKECISNKALLFESQKKIKSIANHSFGADDVIKQYESEKDQLHEQIASLEKELETAAEAGLELNKMVSELLNNQTGSESIITSVEELQQQLNEQEANLIYINNLLAEKSRENNELRVLLSTSNEKFASEIRELTNVNNNLKLVKQDIESEIKLVTKSLNNEIEMERNEKIQFQKDFSELKIEYNDLFLKWQTNSARIETLEDVIRRLNENEKMLDVKIVSEIADINTSYLLSKQENAALLRKLDDLNGSKEVLQKKITELIGEITRIQHEYNESEKVKLEAQTKLDVLSNYFKEKETQLQRYVLLFEVKFIMT